MGKLSLPWIVALAVLVVACGLCTDACGGQKPCPKRCPFRYVHDQNGCRTCQCCPVVVCPFCWRGYIIAKGENRCMSCHCKWGL